MDLKTLPFDSGFSSSVFSDGFVVGFDLDERSTVKLVTNWDMEAGLSVLVLVATEEVEDQDDMA